MSLVSFKLRSSWLTQCCLCPIMPQSNWWYLCEIIGYIWKGIKIIRVCIHIIPSCSNLLIIMLSCSVYCVISATLNALNIYQRNQNNLDNGGNLPTIKTHPRIDNLVVLLLSARLAGPAAIVVPQCITSMKARPSSGDHSRMRLAAQVKGQTNPAQLSGSPGLYRIMRVYLQITHVCSPNKIGF